MKKELLSDLKEASREIIRDAWSDSGRDWSQMTNNDIESLLPEIKDCFNRGNFDDIFEKHQVNKEESLKEFWELLELNYSLWF